MNQKDILIESLRVRGFSKEIVKAFSDVKREDFVPAELKNQAYEDTALPIGNGQTISQPYTIAVMLSLLDLKKGQGVLEIGSGCGYALALISGIVGTEGEVFGIELVKELSEKSRNNLKGYKNIKIYNRNGFHGLQEKTPFERIIISAGCEEIPKALIDQLGDNGVIVAPIGKRGGQSLISFKKNKGNLKKVKEIPGFVFVPFISPED